MSFSLLTSQGEHKHNILIKIVIFLTIAKYDRGGKTSPNHVTHNCVPLNCKTNSYRKDPINLQQINSFMKNSLNLLSKTQTFQI